MVHTTQNPLDIRIPQTRLPELHQALEHQPRIDHGDDTILDVDTVRLPQLQPSPKLLDVQIVRIRDRQFHHQLQPYGGIEHGSLRRAQGREECAQSFEIEVGDFAHDLGGMLERLLFESGVDLLVDLLQPAALEEVGETKNCDL